MVKICPKCFTELEDSVLFCNECGYKISEFKKNNSIFLNGLFFLILIPVILIIGIIIISNM